MQKVKSELLQQIHEQYADEIMRPKVEDELNKVLEQYPMMESMLTDNPLDSNEDINVFNSSNMQICERFSEDKDVQAAVTFFRMVARVRNNLKLDNPDYESNPDYKFYDKLYKMMDTYFLEIVEDVLEDRFDDYKAFKDEKLKESRKRGPRKKQDANA